MNTRIRRSIAALAVAGASAMSIASVAGAVTVTSGTSSTAGSAGTTGTGGTPRPGGGTATGRPQGARPANGGFSAHAATIAKVLNVTVTELQTLMQTKSLAQIAAEKGVSAQAVIDAYVAEETAEHPEMAAADIVARVTNFVNGVRPAGGGPREGGRGTPPTGTPPSGSRPARTAITTT